MSVFNKRRKIIRENQEEDRKRWNEIIKKQEKSMNDLLETCYYIKDNHPEYESLNGDERVKLFGKIYNKIHNK